MKSKFNAYLLVFLLLSVSQFLNGQNIVKKVYLSGIIKNFNTQVPVEDMSEFQNFNLPASAIYFIPDSAGRFKITFPLFNANYFRIGRNMLYLIPGDSLYMELDFNKPESTFFRGRNANANFFLASTPFAKTGSFLSSGENIKESVTETVDTILKLSQQREELLNSYTKIPKEFRLFEKARIKADVLNSIFMLYTYYVYQHKIQKDSLTYYANKCNAIRDSFFKKSSSNFLNPAFLKLVVYRRIIETLVYYTPPKDKIQLGIKEYIKLEEFSAKATQLNNKDSLQKIRKEITSFVNSTYKTALLKKINTLLQFGNGSLAKSFNASLINGKAISLSNFKNKIIYIDIWATWCRPCLEQMPSFELLKEKYKQNSNIVFVSLSIDNDFEAWKKNILSRNANGEQWLIDRSKLSAYNVASIPRAILIDKNFKVFEIQADLPDSKKIETILNFLLEKKK